MNRPRKNGWCGRFALAVCAGVTFAVTPAPSAQGQEGEIIVLRQVPPRVAYRQGLPAPPVTVRMSPAREVLAGADAVIRGSGTIGPTVADVVVGVPMVEVLTNAEAATIAAGPSPVGAAGPGPSGDWLGIAARGENGGASRGMGALQGLGPLLSQAGAAAGGQVTRATGRLADTIMGAVAPHSGP